MGFEHDFPDFSILGWEAILSFSDFVHVLSKPLLKRYIPSRTLALMMLWTHHHLFPNVDKLKGVSLS